MAHIRHQDLLDEIDSFLARTGMGPSYFGKIACGNSELVQRLRRGRRIWPETEEQVRSFMSGSLSQPRSAGS